MRIAVIGTGYVGLVSGACLADVGVDVLCMDVDAAKVASLQAGHVPFYEPGLEAVVARTVKAGRLHFTTDINALGDRPLVMLCVGTRQAPDGSADVSAVEAAAMDVARVAKQAITLVTKSTVPVGTAVRLRELVAGSAHPIRIAANPEFLKEGDAVNDFTSPDRIIVGADDDDSRRLLEELYRPLTLREPRVIHMSTQSAELTKYAANAMLAVRISFMNDMAALCEQTGASIDDVRRGVSTDPRIGKAFLYAGAGYGGSCLPKDVKALAHLGRSVAAPQRILEAADAINQQQRGLLLQKLVRHFRGELTGKTIGIWGLSFKPNTDDMREAPSLPLIEGLLAQGAVVRVFDPAAQDIVRTRMGNKIKYATDPYDAVDRADAIVLVTEWSEFRLPDWATVEAKVRQRVLFDGRNIYDAAQLRSRGWSYIGIGRP
jgi:UDPglucose 6-dehydrogenase